MNHEKKISARKWAGILGLAALVSATLLLAPGLRADDDDPGAPAAARAVRLSSVDGDVHLSQGGQVLADQALANTPLFEGTRIDTGNDGRAEIQFEDGSVARISPQSSITLSALRGADGNRDAEILLNGGLGYFELQGESDSNHLRVRFGETVVTAGGFTVLRINLDKAPGEVAVFSGNAHLEGGSSPTLDLHGGESVALNATDPGSYNLSESIEPDSWDAWNSDRDQDLNTSAADRTQATSDLPDNKNPAWNDLDANGNWYNVPDQGYVWSPYEASNPGWDPYGTGYWMDSPSYGYTWISGEPWGYMPYQCGAWNFYSAFGWGWAPGGCSPWWGGVGGWIINIGIAPPRYHYPIRPHPHNPRPMGGHPRSPAPLIAVNRRIPAGNTVVAPRDKSGSVTIAGNLVQPLKPVQQVRLPYNRGGAFSGRSGAQMPSAPYGVRSGNTMQSSGPRQVAIPSTRSGSLYAPVTPRPAGSISAPPMPSANSYSRPAAPVHVAPPPSPPPASHPSVGGGGGHPAGGGGGPHR